ncbi:MAG: hypothetical protein JW724_06685 [Candidatus Altiarchaeota archaeon]|nr:hypothetical protein [Candidatus Altiarchaeota archaeon]
MYLTKEKRRVLLNWGLVFSPVLLSIAYYLLLAVGGLGYLPEPTHLGSTITGYMLMMPNIEGINMVEEVRILSILICIVLIARLASLYKKGPLEVRGKNSDMLLRVAAVSVGIVFGPYITQTLFVLAELLGGSMAENLTLLFSLLEDRGFFIVSLTSLTFLRFVVLYVLAVSFPVLLILCIFKETRHFARIIFEQAFIWITAGFLVFFQLFILEVILGLFGPLAKIPPQLIELPATLMVVATPPLALVLLELAEKALKILYKSMIEEFRETYGEA